MTFTLKPTDDFDRAMDLARPHDEIVLGPGRHTTRGNWAHREWGRTKNDIAIRSHLSSTESEPIRALRAGESQPILALENPETKWDGVTRPDRDLNILWLGSGCRLAGVHFDCSCPSHPEWCTGGPRFFGRFSMRDCRVTGLRGVDRTTEVFAVSSWGDTGGSLVENVTVSGVKPSSYVSGIFLGGTVRTAVLSRVVRCEVDLGSGNWFAYAANFSTSIEACSGRGVEAWFHNDFGDTENVSIIGGSGDASEAAIRLITTVDGVRQLYAMELRVRAPRGLVLWQKSGRMTGGVVLVRAKMDGQYSVAAVAPECPAILIDCDLAKNSECQHKTGSPRPVFINTRGELVLPRFVQT